MLIKVRNASLSIGLDVFLGSSDEIKPVPEAADVFDIETDGGTGFARADMTPIPILSVKESNNPPTEGDELTTTSGSPESPKSMSPIVCATINDL